MKSVSSKKKRKSKKINGFTLVELLAVIAILSVIVTIVIYSVVGIVNNSKNRSYQVTINNIQTSASNYLVEDIGSKQWIDSDYGGYQYQCVTIQNLIDAGYFKSDVLESMIDDDTYVQAGDSIYVERDISSKSITKSILLVGSSVSYSGLCSGINTSGKISVSVNPSSWSHEKEISIKYKLYDYDNVSNYKYNYSYVLGDGSVDKTLSNVFTSSSKVETIEVNKNGTMAAKILDSSGDEIVYRTLIINNIDNEAPSALISSTNNVASKQTVTLTMSDSGSGVESYYFGQMNPNTDDVKWIAVTNNVATTATGESGSLNDGLSNYSDTYVVNSSGTWYLGVMDVCGNMTVVSKEFYKTTLSIEHASVDPSTILTMSGNYFTIPTASVDVSYEFKGWYTTSSYNESSITKYKPTSNSTLYGKVNIRLYKITLNNNGAMIAGSTAVYEVYGMGVYLDSAYTKEMTSSANKITIPEKTGYAFLGYYYYSSTSSTSEGGTLLINNSGYITSDFTNMTFDSNVTIVAQWKDNVSPTCVLKLTTSGVEFESVSDNVGVVSKKLSTDTSTEDSAITEGTVYGYATDAAENTGTCSIDIESSIKYSTVKCTSSNYSNPESACTNYVSDNCKTSKNYKYNVGYCTCWYDEFARVYRWRKNNTLGESGAASCSATVSDYSECDYSQENTNAICSCSSYVSSTSYKGNITCYTNSCSEGYTRFEESNYCYKLG